MTTSGSGRASGGRVLVTGSANTDLVCQIDRFPRPGETVASTSFAVYPGGKAANQAVAASRSGSSVAFVGCFGDDDYGRDRYEELRNEGIDLEYSRICPGEPSGLALIAVDPAGENLIITVGGANDLVTEDQIGEAIRAGGYDIILLPNEAPPAVVRKAVTSGTGARVVLNAAPFAPYLREIASEVDVLICNEVEAAQFLDSEVTVANAGEAVQDLAALTGSEAVITLGEAGAVGWTNGDLRSVPALDVQVVDTTGAGDAFCGAFATWLALGKAFEQALMAGVAAGSLAVTRPGAQPSLPDYDAIVSRL